MRRVEGGSRVCALLEGTADCGPPSWLPGRHTCPVAGGGDLRGSAAAYHRAPCLSPPPGEGHGAEYLSAQRKPLEARQPLLVWPGPYSGGEHEPSHPPAPDESLLL